MLHKIIGDEGGHDGTEHEEEDALNDHTLLLVQDEERSEHQKGMDRGAHHVVAGISHGNRPTKMGHSLILVGAEKLTTKPLGGGLVSQVHSVQRRNEGKEVAEEKQEATDQT